MTHFGRGFKVAVAVVAMVAASIMLTACGSGGGTSNAQSTSSASKTISVMYADSFEFDSQQLDTQWWQGIKQEFEAKYPGYKVNLEPVGGTDVDLVTKAALSYRSPSLTPDIVALPTSNVSQFASSGYLEPLDSYLNANKTFWPYVPDNVRALTVWNGQQYAVDHGNNVSGIFYNKTMFAKAGIPVPWTPRDWADIIAAAQKLKKALPKVVPLWVVSGTQSSTFGVQEGVGNLIYASKTPVMFDPKTQKWVVDSPGLRDTLQFVKTIDQQGLGAPISMLNIPQSVNLVPDFMRKGEVAMAVGCNFYPGAWAYSFAFPWPAASKVVGVTPVPNEQAGAPAASTLAGWAFVLSKSCSNKPMAENLIDLMMQTKNQVDMANWAGFVPPTTYAQADPGFKNFAQPQGEMAGYVNFSQALPDNPNFPVYARAINQATGELAQDPSTSVEQCIKTITSVMTNQLGANQVETAQ